MRSVRGLLLAATLALLVAAPAQAQAPKVLVYTKTAGTAHPSTTSGVAAIRALGTTGGFTVEDTADPAAYFTYDKLKEYAAVVFLSTAGDVLSADQESAFQLYYREGGGFVGIHDAARLEPSSTWFTSLIGARPNAGSPTAVQSAVVEVQDQAHPAGRGLPTEWTRSDEWFNWQPNPAGNVNVIANLRERSYTTLGTGANGWEHPITWCRDFESGRSFYTGMGHTPESYAETDFQKHLLGGIQWAAGLIRGNCKATIDASYTAERLTAPDAFTGNTPESQMGQIGEPHGLDVDSKGRVFYIGRAAKGNIPPVTTWGAQDAWRGWGTVHVYDPSKPSGQRVKLAGTLDVFGHSGSGDELVKKEEGLLGIALDPNFDTNHYIYLHYTPYLKEDFVRHVGTRRIARFTFNEATGTLDLASEKPILEWTYQNHSCCHMGGDMGFDKDGNLYVLAGDTNSSGNAGAGYSGNVVPPKFPNDASGIGFNDARRTAGNTNDLNGKIIRIKPLANPGTITGIGSTYEIPPGNLFTGTEEGGGKTRREIYVMGVRNPTRMWLDKQTGWLMTGWVGPDAANPSATLGPARYENMAAIPKAGNYGWPYCTGDNQPYRDRNIDGQVYEAGNAQGKPVTGWYDCNNIVNDSPWNTGLKNLPPATPTNMWLAGGGGGARFPIDQATGRPNYGATPTYTEPYLPSGGGQSTMPGPLYRYSESNPSATKFPEFWDSKWFIDDHDRGGAQRAIGLDADTVDNHKQPKLAVDVTGIIGKTGTQAMGMDFGADGNLYVLDYGGGFFSVTAKSSLWKVSYTGGAATPGASARAVPIGNFEADFFSNGSGGVSRVWDFGDGQTSTAANPRHKYAEAKTYNVKLTVTYADDKTDVTTTSVDVLAAPDETAPVTTHTLSPPNPDQAGKYTKPVTVTLTATDQGGSKVDRTEYRVGTTGEFQVYTAPVRRTQPGDYVIEYRSRDRAGNVEATKSVSFSITPILNCPTVLNDEFDAGPLNTKWQVLRSTTQSTSVTFPANSGRLRLKIEAGDMQNATATAKNVLLQPAPDSSFVVTTRFNVSELTTSGEQAGLVLWQSEGTNANTFSKIVWINKGSVWHFEHFTTRNSSGGFEQTGDRADFPTGDVYLRVTASGRGRYVAEGSTDGESWEPIGTPIENMGDPNSIRIGLKQSNGTASTHGVLFDYFRVDCSDRMPPQTTAKTTPFAADGNVAWYKTAPKVELTPDEPVSKLSYRVDGDGDFKPYTTPFTVEGEGDHTIEYFGVDTAEEPNTEPVKRMLLRVDSGAPTTTMTYGGDLRPGGTAKVKLDGDDGKVGSGIGLTQYRVDGGPWKAYEANPEVLLDGSELAFSQWRQAPSGQFNLLTDGSGGITPVGGLGMLWYPVKQYGDFRVKLQFREGRSDGGYSNGGVFVRFPDARVPSAARPDECARTGSAATQEAWVAIYCGHEIQLMDDPAGSEPQKTGSIYNFQSNDYSKIGTPKRGSWEDYEVEVRGQHYVIRRNGVVINDYMNTPDKRSSRAGDPPAAQRQLTRGYIGLQNHSTSDVMQYRNVSVEDLTPGAATANPSGIFDVTGDGPHTIEWRSIDAAGNTERTQSDVITIGADAPGGTATLPTTPGAGMLPPLIETAKSFRLGTITSKVRVATLASKGILVPVRCTGAMAGSATLTVSAADAKRLKLSRRTLDSSDVRCWGPHTASVRLRPSSALAKRLRAKGGPKSIKLTLSVQMRDWGKPATTTTKTITLSR